MDQTKILELVALALNTIKPFAKYLIIPAGVVTFFPDNWLSYIRLIGLKNMLGAWIAGVFFVSLSIIAIDFLKKRREYKNLCKRLLNLNNSEKSIVKNLFDNDSSQLNMLCASVSKLEKLDIIFKPPIWDGGAMASYTLQPWALEYLRKNPEYFKEATPNE